MQHGKKTTTMAVAIAAALLLGLSQPGSAVIVNVDFNGFRPGDPGVPPTFVGSGAAGGGTVFNGVTADSSGGNDNLALVAPALLSDTGAGTTVGLTIGPVGGDDNPSGPLNALWRDYLFIHSAGNAGTTTPIFTISGLGSAPTADLYFYHMFDSGSTLPLTITIAGEASDPFAPVGIFTAANTLFFDNVPVIGGTIVGTWGIGAGTEIMSGLTIVFTTIPEPSTLAMLGLGGLGLVWWRRRKA